MNIFNPTLKSLKQKLQILPVNTGKKFTHNGQACGIVFDDIERLHAMGGINDCVHLKSGAEFSLIQYRGQNEDFGVCNSTLDRLNSIEEQFLNICKTIAFEELLEVHPFMQFVKTKSILDKPICVNTTGIAQHYGLHTNYLDITNNFDVACFFATCKYQNGKYFPICNVSKPGIIYKIIEMLLPPFIDNEYNKGIEIEYLGWQPLPRPEQQRASVLKISKDVNLDTINNVEKYYFKHSISQSRQIWKQFDEGKTLFPNDSASDLANECKKLNSFTNNQIKKAFQRLESWAGKTIDNQADILDSLKIEIIKCNNLSWKNLVEIKPEYWENKFYETMNKVGYRMTSPHQGLINE